MSSPNDIRIDKTPNKLVNKDFKSLNVKNDYLKML